MLRAEFGSGVRDCFVGVEVGDVFDFEGVGE